jgi:hypothetical protein
MQVENVKSLIVAEFLDFTDFESVLDFVGIRILS